MTLKRPLLLGCGIFHKEIDYLIAKNNWPIDTDFLAPSLHVNFNKLEHELIAGLHRNAGRNTLVFYGTCHPCMDNLLAAQDIPRIQGQNCVEMLLGHDLFMHYLEQGAFFLLEDWVNHWDTAIIETFGKNPKVTQEIFQICHRFLLSITTPCSGDFSQAADAIGQRLGLPVQTLAVNLDPLENLLRHSLNLE